MAFQTTAYITPPIGFPGGSAGGNKVSTAIPPTPNGFTAGAAGVTIGRWVWTDANGACLNTGTGKPTGFLHRGNKTIISAYMAESNYVIHAGRGIDAPATQGDFLALATNAVTFTPGTQYKAFAKLSDGTTAAFVAGSANAGYVETSFTITNSAAVGELYKMTAQGAM